MPHLAFRGVGGGGGEGGGREGGGGGGDIDSSNHIMPSL